MALSKRRLETKVIQYDNAHGSDPTETIQGVVTLNAFVKRLVDAINHGSRENFVSILAEQYVFPTALGPERVTEIRLSGTHCANDQAIATYTDIFYVCPVIDALLLNKAALKTLVDTLIIKNCPAWYQLFKMYILNTQFSVECLEWTMDMKTNTLARIDDMSAYATTLNRVSPAVKKAKRIEETVSSLRGAIDEYSLPRNQEPRNLHEEQFKNLSFKLDLHARLEEHMDAFAEHRGYKRLLTNLMTLLFTAGVANLVHKASTGHWMFFNKTTTEEKVDKINDALRIK